MQRSKRGRGAAVVARLHHKWRDNPAYGHILKWLDTAPEPLFHSALPCQASLSWNRRYGLLMFSRNSSQVEGGIARKTSTTLGSNCFPEQRSISARACDIGRAFRYGRSEIIASNASATAKMR